MLMTASPRRLSSTVWVLASLVSLGLAGCAAKYDNRVGITPQPVQILWNTNGPAQVSCVPMPLVTPVNPCVPAALPPTDANPEQIPPPAPPPTVFGTLLSTTPLGPAELDAVADTPGAFVYSPAEGSFLAPGTQTLSVTFTPKDTTHYAVTKDTVQIVVSDPTSAAGQAATVPQAVQIVGGGYVDGAFFHPKQQGLRYVRTDVGGAYRWQQVALTSVTSPTTGVAVPTCSGYPNTLTLYSQPKGGNGQFLQCGYWVPLLDFLGRANGGDMGVESLGLDPSDPQRLYLSTGLNYNNDPKQQNHFYLSDDQGKTFPQVINAPFPINGNANGRDAGERMAVDPNLGTTIYYGSRTAGLWKSLDRGLTWNKVTSFPVTGPTAGAGVVFITFVPASGATGAATPVLFAGVSDYNYYASDGSNNGTPLYSSIYRSVDAGSTWQPVPGQPTSIAASSGTKPTKYNLTPIHGIVGPDGVPNSQGSFFVTYFSDQGPGSNVGAGNGAVYEYTPTVGVPNGPGKWTAITPPRLTGSPSDSGGYSGLTLDAERPGVIMVSTMDDYNAGDAIYRSLDYGKTWTIVEQNNTGAINDSAYSPWLQFGSGVAAIPTENWPSALAIDPFDSNHAIFGSGQTLWDTGSLLDGDIGHQPVFSVGAYGSAPSPDLLKQIAGGSSIEETVVLALSSPPTGVPLLSAVGDLGTFVHTTLDASPLTGADHPPLFTTGTSVDFAQNSALHIVRVGNGSSVDVGPYYPDPSASTKPTICDSTHLTGCLHPKVPQLFATSTTQGTGNTPWTGFATLYAAPTLQSVTPTTKVSAGGGTVAIAPDATTIVWATTDFPPACTADGGLTWTPAINGIIGAQVVSDRVTPGKYYMYDSKSGALLMGVATINPGTISTPFVCNLTFNPQSILPAYSYGQLTASFGGAGDIWLAVNGSSLASANGLYHSIDSGKTLTNVGAFTQAYAVGLGAAATSSAFSAFSKPAIYTAANGASGYGFYRSIDNGVTWMLVSNPAHLMGYVGQIVGDARTFGRYYIGTGGRGIAYADSQ